MCKLIGFLLLFSCKAYSVENCNFKNSTILTDIEKYKPNLSELEVVRHAEKSIKKEKISIPKDWCRDISLTKEEENLIWEVFYTGNELDSCFSILINDKTKKSYLEYCP